MLYREDKRTGKQLSALGFGCMRFPRKGGGIDFDRSSKMLYTAIDGGVNYLDTAYIYGGSEAFLGQALTPEYRSRVSLATKLPLFMIKTAADIDKYFVRSLERLKTGHIEYFLMHMLTSTDVWNRLCGLGIEQWIAEQKKNGKIGSIGFSYHGGRAEFPKLLEAYDWDFCQIQYNYLDEFNQAGRSGLELAESKGIPVIIMEPLRGGKLAANLPAQAMDILNRQNPQRSPAEWGLRWVWNHPGVTCVLSGMSDEAQLEENLRVASDAKPGSLTQEELDAVAGAKKVLDANIKVPCTACGYCMPCPKGVDIPTCFASLNTMVTAGKTSARRVYMQNIDALNTDAHYAGKCIGCGKCEQHCPQSIEIRKELSYAAKVLEPWWFKAGMSVLRTFMGRKNS